jgi:polysaccharide biosynthesis transport protein
MSHAPSNPSSPPPLNPPPPGASEIVGVEVPPPGGIALAQVGAAIRRRLLLVLAVSACTATAALLVFRQPLLYRATAVVRLAAARAGLPGGTGMQEALPALLGRSPTPLMSLLPRLRSRTVAGMVVDSLGLQLTPVPAFSLRGALTPPTHSPVLGLRDVRVDPTAPADTLYLRFSKNEVRSRRDSLWVHAAYGKPLRVGPARFTVTSPPETESMAYAVLRRDEAIDMVLTQLAVDPVEGTDALEVRYTDPDPARAQQVTNLIVQTFLASNIRLSQEQAQHRRLFLAGQLEETERMLARAHAKLTAFQSRQQMGNSAARLAAQQATLMSLDARRGEMESNRDVYQAILTQLESSSDNARAEALRTLAYSPEIATDRNVERLNQQLLAYRTRLDSLTTGPWRSSPENPDVKQLQEVIRSSQEELVRAVRAQLKSLEQRTSALAALRTRNADSMQALPALQAEETRLGQHVLALTSLADQLRLEHEKARMSEEFEAGEVDVVDLAALPYEPTGIPWLLKVASALLLSLPMGAGVATLLEMRNRSIRSPEELERVLHLRGLGVIPQVGHATSVRSGLALLRRGLKDGEAGAPSRTMVGDVERPSVGLEAFRLLYTNLIVGWGERQRTILVTSVAPREGKTLVAANLAVTFAQQGARVLLVDCDLRRPLLHKLFRVPRKPGLLELLNPESAPAEGGQPLENRVPAGPSYGMFAGLERPSDDLAAQVGTPGTGGMGMSSSGTSVRRTTIKRLSLLPCGNVPRNPGEVLNAATMRRVLDGLAEHFDVIILDSPPVLVSADAPILGTVADGVLLVIRAGQTDREAAEWAYHQLVAAGGLVIGTVLNDPEGEVARDRSLYYAYDYPAVAD